MAQATGTLPEIGQYRIAKDIGGDRVRYEDIEVGKDLGTAPLLITQGQIDSNSAKFDFYHPWYSVNSPWGGTVVPIGMTYVVGRRLLSATYNVVGMFYKHSFDFFHPIMTGVEYSFSAHISEKWIRNDREFVAYEGTCKDASGTLMFNTRRAHVLDYIKRTVPKIAEGGVESRPTVFDYKSPTPYGTPTESKAPSAVTSHVIDLPSLATIDTPLGAPMPSFAHVYTAEYLDRRSGVAEGGFRSHDTEAARREGLPRAFVGAGASTMFEPMAIQFFGKGWVEGGKGELTMVRPVFVDDFCTTKGFVRSKDLLADGSVRLTCQAWAENQTGETTNVATLSGIVG
jgi:hypothetical protein